MTLVLAETIDVTDGPECPECGACHWRASIGSDRTEETPEALLVHIRLLSVECRECGLQVELDDDDDVPGGMRWQADPSDRPSWDLP